MNNIFIQSSFGIDGYSTTIQDFIKKDTTREQFESKCENDNYFTPATNDMRGRTVLHVAVEKENIELIKYLSEINQKSGNPDEQDPLKKWKLIGENNLFLIHNNDGLCPLHIAAQNGSMLAVKELVKQGSPLNMLCLEPDREWISPNAFAPFDSAFRNGHMKVAGFLLRHGGAPNFCPNSDDFSAAEKEIMYDNEKLVKMHFDTILPPEVTNTILGLMVETELK